MNYLVIQLACDVEDVVDNLVEEIEQIQEDISEEDEQFSKLQELKKKFNEILEITGPCQAKCVN